MLNVNGPTIVGLQQHFGRPEGDTFDPRRTGLDHLAFAVADRAALEEWERHLAAHGVKYSPIAPTPFGPVLCFRDPDDIQLELFTTT